MKKTTYFLATLILLTTVSFAELTEEEKKYGDLMLSYYAGRYISDTANRDAILQYVYGDKDKKRSMLKDFIKNVVIPDSQKKLNNLNIEQGKYEEDINSMQNYVK